MNYNRYNQNQSRPHRQNQDRNMQNQEQNTHYPHWQRRISIEEAMNIALGQVPGQVVKVELDHEKGVLVYEVDIVTAQGVRYEVIIDVNTGAILEVKLD